MSPLFAAFSPGSLVKETTATSGKVNQHCCLGPPTSSKKDFSVVTSPVTAERERVSSFCREGSFLCMRHPFSSQGLLGVSAVS